MTFHRLGMDFFWNCTLQWKPLGYIWSIICWSLSSEISLSVQSTTCYYIRGLVSEETVVLRWWGVERNVWLINRVEKLR